MKRPKKNAPAYLLFILPFLGFILQSKYNAPNHFDHGIPSQVHHFPGEPVIHSTSGNNIVLYEKQASLSATMKHIQEVYSEWQKNQIQSLKMINEGTYYTTALMMDDSPELHNPSHGVFDKDTRRRNGALLWELVQKRGQNPIISSRNVGHDQTAFFAWVTEAVKPCELSIGIYGGDQMTVISKHTRLWVQVVNGIVPVNPDGSAHFTVPANKNIFLQALDKDYQEIQRMRTTVNFQPGERRSCIGCHETRLQAPDAAGVLAMGQEPLTPGPQPGEISAILITPTSGLCRT